MGSATRSPRAPRIVRETRNAGAVAKRVRSFGRIRDYPRGESRIFFVKSLA